MLRPVVFLIVLTLSTVAQNPSGRAYAEICYYVGPDQGSWHVPDNWSSEDVPGSGDTARIFDDLAVEITQDITDLWEMRLGYTHSGQVIQNGGQVSANSVQLGRQDGEFNYPGTYILNDGTLTPTSLFVGQSNAANRFVMHGGTLDPWIFSLGDEAGANEFVIYDGIVNVRSSVFYIATDAYGTSTTRNGTFIQHGGHVLAENGLHLGGSIPDRTGAYILYGGEATLQGIEFHSGATSYIDIRGGALQLLGDWDYERLTGLEYSNFRAYGSPATESNLDFSLVVIGEDVYTQITAIPEPSTLALLGIGAVSLLAYVWRRRRSRHTR